MDREETYQNARGRVAELKELYADIIGFALAGGSAGLLAAAGHGGQ